MCRTTSENCNFYVFYKKCFNDVNKKQAFGLDETLISRNHCKHVEKPTSTSSIKKRYKTQFRIKRNENERMQPSELTVFFSQNGRPDEKKKKHGKATSGTPLYFYDANEHFLKSFKTRTSVYTVNFQSECASAAKPVCTQNGRFPRPPLFRYRRKTRDCQPCPVFNYLRTLNPEGFREKTQQ